MWTHLNNPDTHATWAASIPFIGMALQATPKLPIIVTRLMEVAIVAACVMVFNNSKTAAVQEVKLENLSVTQQEITQDVRNVRTILEAFIRESK